MTRTEEDGKNDCDERENREQGVGAKIEEKRVMTGKKRDPGGGSEGKRGVKGKKARGIGGVVRVQRNEISGRKRKRGDSKLMI